MWIVVSDRFVPANGEVVSGQVHETAEVKATDDRAGDVTREAGVLTKTFTYGKVPNGFRQLVPSTGQPPRLGSGRGYVLNITGDEQVRLAFKSKNSDS